MTTGDDRVERIPPLRRLVVDAPRAGKRRNPIHGLVECDITTARDRIRMLRATGTDVSTTAFVIGCVGRAAAAHPRAHAYRDLRGRLVIPSRAHVATLVETRVDGAPFAFVHLLHDTDRRSVDDLTAEIRAAQRDPRATPAGRLLDRAGWLLLAPGPIRVLGYRTAARSRRARHELLGTIAVSAVGMFAGGGGFGVAMPTLYTLGVLVGGLSRRPWVVGDEVVPRDVLQLTMTFDHDHVDGAPAARFAADLRARLEGADGLDQVG